MPAGISESMLPQSAPAALVIPPVEGRILAAFGSTLQLKLEGGHTQGSLTLGLAVTPPGEGPPLHVHRHDDELFIVIEGDLSFLTPTGWVATSPGTVVYLPRGAPHTFRNLGTTPSRHWVLTLPSGFEQFYSRCAALFAKGPPNPQEIRAIAAEYGYEFLGPAPGPTGQGASGLGGTA